MELRRPVPDRLEVVLHQRPGEVLAFLVMVAVIAVAMSFAAPAESRLIVVLGIVGAGAAWSLFALTVTTLRRPPGESCVRT